MAGIDWKQGGALLQRLQQPLFITRAVTTTNVVLVLLLAYSLARLTWLMFPPVFQELPPAPATRPSAASVAQIGAAATKDIAQWHMFGTLDLSAPAPVKQEIVETNLQLELRGILASSDPNFARAIVSEPAREENFYAVGASLPGGAILKEIFDDHIVLLRAGRLETLKLPKDRAPMGGGGAPLDDRASAIAPPSADGSRQISGGESLREIRDAVMTDPQMLAGLLRAEPVVENGAVSGFRLGEGQDPRVLRRFGLQRGDIVTSLNDVKLDGPNKVPDLMRMLPSAQELRIEYKRNGKPRSIVLNMSE